MKDYINSFFSKIAIYSIKFYQKSSMLSTGVFKNNNLPGLCRFTPSCSQYGLEAITKYGIIKGGIKMIWRILRCNPWNKGGHDPLL